MAQPTVSQGQAQTVSGASKGWADFNTAAEGEFDLTSCIDKYVKISCVSQGFYVCFFAATGGTIGSADAATETNGIPELIPANSKDHIVVPRQYPFMRYKPVTGTGTITVVVG